MLQAPSVARWTRQLDALHARLAPHFARPESRARARAYLQSVLAGAERRNGWQLAEAAGEGTPEGVLIVDETGFLKKGDQSAGVHRQYSGIAGRIDNCQVGVFLAYTSRKGHAFVDRALYLPRAWCDDPTRCRAAGIPHDVAFRTKPDLARDMLTRALDAGVAAAWVTGDAVYGDAVYGCDRRLRLTLGAWRQLVVLAVRSTDAFFHTGVAGKAQPWAAAIADALPADAWQASAPARGRRGRECTAERGLTWCASTTPRGAMRCSCASA